MLSPWFRSLLWEPFEDWGFFPTMRRWQWRLNRLSNDLVERSLVGSDYRFNVREEADQYVVKAVLPGLRPENIDLNFAQDTLTIRAEWPTEEDGQVRYLLHERQGGRLERWMRFPLPVEAEQIEASYENGILTVIVPKAEAVRPKHIAIKTATAQLTSGQNKVIEGQSEVVTS